MFGNITNCQPFVVLCFIYYILDKYVHAESDITSAQYGQKNDADGSLKV